VVHHGAVPVKGVRWSHTAGASMAQGSCHRGRCSRFQLDSCPSHSAGRECEGEVIMADTTPKTAAQLVANARAQVENLGPDAVAAELARGDALLVDLRESEECAQQGTIAGAVHAPRGMLEFYADPTSPYHRAEFDPERRVILHCASGGRS